MDRTVIEESQKTRCTRKTLEGSLKNKESLTDRASLEERKQITKCLERHESERFECTDDEPVDPGDEIEAFLDQLKKRELGL